MSEFEDRGRGEERKYELDRELEFKAQARRNKLLGLWVAGLLGLDGAEAEAYAKTVVLADLAQAGEEDVFAKVRADLDSKGAQASDQQIRSRMAELMIEARAQIQAGS